MSEKADVAVAADPKPTPVAGEAPWYLPKKPSNPTHTSQVHVLAHASTSRLVRVCYTKGAEGSYVAVRSNKAGGFNVATNVHLGACTDIEGTDIEITNNNSEPASGTYQLLS